MLVIPHFLNFPVRRLSAGAYTSIAITTDNCEFGGVAWISSLGQTDAFHWVGINAYPGVSSNVLLFSFAETTVSIAFTQPTGRPYLVPDYSYATTLSGYYDTSSNGKITASFKLTNIGWVSSGAITCELWVSKTTSFSFYSSSVKLVTVAGYSSIGAGASGVPFFLSNIPTIGLANNDAGFQNANLYFYVHWSSDTAGYTVPDTILYVGSAYIYSYCGNGYVEAGEACDQSYASGCNACAWRTDACV